MINRLSLTFRGKEMTIRQQESVDFYIGILPWLIGFLAFTGGPIVFSLVISMSDWSGVRFENTEFVGLANFGAMWTDDLFWISLSNTFLYSFGAVLLGTIGALIAAILMNQNVPGVTLFRTIYYIPSVTSGVAVAILWIWLLNPSVGLINYFIQFFVGPEGLIPLGWRGPGWLADPDWALAGLVLKSAWAIGQNMIILLAGLQGIPQSLYDAAKIDGANLIGELRNVTLPMLSPVIFFVIVVSIIGTFQVFIDAFVMTNGGGPGTSTYVYLLHLYKNAFEYLQMGYASALSWVLTLIIGALTYFQLVVGRKWVYYEGGEKG